MRKLIAIISVLVASVAFFSWAAEPLATARNAEIETTTESPQISKVVNSDIKQKRNYPMQPPLIPHTIRGYEINTNVNKCMACHSRQRTEESQAPMVSVTHFMDRDGNFLAEVSPRRYFCDQCHVTQTEVKKLVENDYVDMYEIMSTKAEGEKE